jgi:ABC-type branched-subunit amino acid transport system ATPase component
VARDGVFVVAHVTFAVAAGELAVVVGDNGAGKSTLCGVLSGLVGPDTGSVTVAGELVVEPELRGVFPGLDVDDNLAVVLADRSTRADVYARFPALAARRDVDAHALSGGEQQMLALAPPLVRPPSVLVVDEPFLGLAPQAAIEVARRLDEIRAAGTAVLVTGEVVPGVLTPDRVYRMTRGRLEVIPHAV